MSDVLHVWVDDRCHVGSFIRDDDNLVKFRYDSDTDVPISVSLPLDGNWTAHAPEAFLDNLLPDEETARHAMMRRLGAASTDVFDLLDGVDSTGGLVFTHSDDVEDIARTIEPVDENMLADQIALIERRPHSWWNEEGVHERFSLAGAQGKFSLTRIQDEMSGIGRMLLCRRRISSNRSQGICMAYGTSSLLSWIWRSCAVFQYLSTVCCPYGGMMRTSWNVSTVLSGMAVSCVCAKRICCRPWDCLGG